MDLKIKKYLETFLPILNKKNKEQIVNMIMSELIYWNRAKIMS